MMKELRMNIEMCRKELYDLIDKRDALNDECIDLVYLTSLTMEEAFAIRECRRALREEIRKINKRICDKREEIDSLKALYDDLYRKDLAPYKQLEVYDYVDSIRKDGCLIAAIKF